MACDPSPAMLADPLFPQSVIVTLRPVDSTLLDLLRHSILRISLFPSILSIGTLLQSCMILSVKKKGYSKIEKKNVEISTY
jgi:hypothetical protein